MRTNFPLCALMIAALSLGSLALCAAPSQAQAKKMSQSAALKQAVTQADGITNRVIDKVWIETDEYWHHGDYNRIVALIRFIVEADPTFYEAYGDGAWLIWSMGDTKNADEFLEYGIARAPRKWALQYEFGWHLYNTKRFAEALPYLQKAVTYPSGPGWPPWHVLAHCYDRLGQTKKSLETWEYIVRKFPNDPSAKPNLERLRRESGGSDLKSFVLSPALSRLINLLSDVNAPPSAGPSAVASDVSLSTPSEGDVPPKRVPAPLPRTLWVWLTIIALIWAAPLVFPERAQRAGRASAASRAAGETVLSSESFKQLMQAEAVIRSSVGLKAILPSVGQKGADLSTAIRPLEKVAQQTGAPGPARRAIIARHLRGDTINDAALQAFLVPNLKKAGRAPQEIKGELALWRALYGSPKPRVTPTTLGPEDKRIREMRLGFLQPLVLADLYRVGGDKKLTARFEDELNAASGRHVQRFFTLTLSQILAFLAGFVLLVIFATAAITKRWTLVGRVATVPQTLAWGELLDAFAFYLAFFQGIGLVVGTFAARLLSTLSPRETLLFMGGIQIVTGLVSVAYLAATCRRRGVSLADVGLTTRGKSLASQIGYGALGWCASLPILIALGLINQRIFQNAPDTTPNPILPLMLAERNLVGRLLIFAMASVAAPFFEEVFFRGALLGALRQRFNWVPAALFSGVVFALLHPQADWIPIIGLGFTFAAMREMRQSLIPGITAHFLQNTITFLTISAIYGS